MARALITVMPAWRVLLAALLFAFGLCARAEQAPGLDPEQSQIFRAWFRSRPTRALLNWIILIALT